MHWPIDAASADQVAFVGKSQIGWILGEKVKKGDASRNRQGKRATKSFGGLWARVSCEGEDAVVGRPESDFGVGDGRAFGIEHAHFGGDVLSWLDLRPCGGEGDLEARLGIGHAELADTVAAVGGFKFSGTLFGATNDDHGDENIGGIGGFDGDF